MSKILHILIGLMAVGILITLFIYFEPLWVVLGLTLGAVGMYVRRHEATKLLNAKLEPNIEQELRRNALTHLFGIIMILMLIFLQFVTRILNIDFLVASIGGMMVGSHISYLLFVLPMYMHYTRPSSEV